MAWEFGGVEDKNCMSSTTPANKTRSLSPGTRPAGIRARMAEAAASFPRPSEGRFYRALFQRESQCAAFLIDLRRFAAQKKKKHVTFRENERILSHKKKKGSEDSIRVTKREGGLLFKKGCLKKLTFREVSIFVSKKTAPIETAPKEKAPSTIRPRDRDPDTRQPDRMTLTWSSVSPTSSAM